MIFMRLEFQMIDDKQIYEIIVYSWKIAAMAVACQEFLFGVRKSRNSTKKSVKTILTLLTH